MNLSIILRGLFTAVALASLPAFLESSEHLLRFQGGNPRYPAGPSFPAAFRSGSGGDFTAVPLFSGDVLDESVAAGADDLSFPDSTDFYEVLIPPETEVFEVRVVMRSGDADLFMGPNMSYNIGDYPFYSAVIGSGTDGGLVDQTMNPPLGANEIWYLAVHGYEATEYTIIVCWGSADAATALSNGQTVTGQVGTGFDMVVYPGSTRYFSVNLGAGAEDLVASVETNSANGDVDLFLGRELTANPYKYDFYSTNEGTVVETIRVDGTTNPAIGASSLWYIAVHGFYGSDFTLKVFWEEGQALPSFRRGDANGDGKVDISDPVVHLAYLFQAGSVPCLAACDSNNDDKSDISDAVTTLAFLFQSGAAPAPPFPDCGKPEKAPALDCATTCQ